MTFPMAEDDVALGGLERTFGEGEAAVVKGLLLVVTPPPISLETGLCLALWVMMWRSLMGVLVALTSQRSGLLTPPPVEWLSITLLLGLFTLLMSARDERLVVSESLPPPPDPNCPPPVPGIEWYPMSAPPVYLRPPLGLDLFLAF